MKNALPRGMGFLVFFMLTSDKRRGRAVACADTSEWESFD